MGTCSEVEHVQFYYAGLAKANDYHIERLLHWQQNNPNFLRKLCWNGINKISIVAAARIRPEPIITQMTLMGVISVGETEFLGISL